MSPATIRMKSFIYDTFTNSAAWFGAIASWQSNLEYLVKIVAGFAAIAVSCVTIYYKVKNNGKDK